ncbi:MAG: esterase-like activity of phytase family protein [Anaerolineae bacterium]|nr:esterase-like activity of phytase family protein [Anaerolineae bacterium]
MRPRLIRLFILVIVLALPLPVVAQGAPAKLVGRAILPADTLATGPQAGQALAPRDTINGLKVPFDSQPVGSISAIAPSSYAGAWLALTNGVFDTRQNSGDYLLRLYTMEIDWLTANGGNGSVTVLDWKNLTDPAKKITQAIRNANTQTRELTGADFDVRGLAQASDGSLWVADSYGPALLHFDANGQLLDAPIALAGAGPLQGVGALPGQAGLVVAQRASGSNTEVVLRAFDTDKRAIGAALSTYPLSAAANNLSDLVMISNTQAVVIEQDAAQNQAAQFKRLFLVDLSAKPARKTLLVDLLNIADAASLSTAPAFANPSGTFGLGAAFKFPYLDAAALYPTNAQTLLIVNNNHVPFGLGRSNAADATEFIAVQLAQPLTFDPAFRTAR